jgi:hypothetical protein
MALGGATGGTLALGWVATGAIVHASHHNYGRAIGSVLMRVGFPLLGVALGAASANGCSGDLCALGPAILGGFIGIGTAEVVDLVVAREEVEQPIAPARHWSPVVTARSSAVSFGVAGHF